jgi:hypothetical protein
LLGYYNDHVDGTSDLHVASDIEFTPGASLWADSSGIAATDVEAAINEIISDLTNSAGAARINAAAGSAWIDTTTNPAATIQAKLNKIITDLGTGTGGAAKVSAADLAGWHDGSSVSPGTKSVQNMLAGIVSALGVQTGNGGADKVGVGAQSKTSGSYTETTAASSVWDQIGELLTSLTLKARLAGNNVFTGANTFNTSPVVHGADLLANAAGVQTARLSVAHGDGGSLYKTLLLYSERDGSAPDRTIACYLVSGSSSNGEGLELTGNAKWNATSGVWEKWDTSDNNSWIVRLTRFGIQIASRSVAGSGTWSEAGWTYELYDVRHIFTGQPLLSIYDGRVKFTSAGAVSNLARTATPETNTLYAKTLVKAWGLFSTLSDAVTPVEGFNTGTHTLDGATDRVTVNLNNALSDTNYIVLTHDHEATSNATSWLVVSKATGSFVLQARITDTHAVENLGAAVTRFCSFVVLGVDA